MILAALTNAAAAASAVAQTALKSIAAIPEAAQTGPVTQTASWPSRTSSRSSCSRPSSAA